MEKFTTDGDIAEILYNFQIRVYYFSRVIRRHNDCRVCHVRYVVCALFILFLIIIWRSGMEYSTIMIATDGNQPNKQPQYIYIYIYIYRFFLPHFLLSLLFRPEFFVV